MSKRLLAACCVLWCACAAATTAKGSDAEGATRLAARDARTTPAARVASSRAERVAPAGEVVLVLNEQFFNALLDAITSQPTPPTYPLSRGGAESNGCRSEVSLLRESQGTRTAVRLQEGRISAPVAFRGSYAAPLVGCLKFEGWADTILNLAFDRERQALDARIEVRAVNLKRVPASLVGGGLAGLVQDAIDQRVNPIEILRAEQLGARVPVTREGELRLRATEVRHEITNGELRLHIIYEIVSTP